MSRFYEQQFNRLSTVDMAKFKVSSMKGGEIFLDSKATHWMNANPESLQALIDWATKLKEQMEKEDEQRE
ncbi:MAG: hypothetical protein HRT93_03320 [Piscirickettsiaceae bacterium]|nr:hypothetical protein [Piscirickettsiaceae bacterium]